MSYYPKRPVRSFQDLEVYQKTLAICVIIVKRIKTQVMSDSSEVNEIISKLYRVVLDLPVLVAHAHSIRFSDHTQAVAKLEETMLNCNLSVVYLEQFRDLANQKIETDFFTEQIKNLLAVRIKIMHLQRSWRKFFEKK